MFSETISFLNVSTRRFLSTLLRQEWLLCAVVIYHWTKTMRLWLGWNRWDALGLIGVKMWFNLLGVLNLQRPDSLSFQTTFCVEDAFETIRTRQQIEVFERNIHVFRQFVESLCFALLWFELWVDTELCLLQRRWLRSRLCVRISSTLVVWSCAVRRVHRELRVSCTGMKMRKSQRARHIIFREIDISRHL